MRHFGTEAGAALIFLIGYILVFAGMTYAFITKRFKLHSRYSLLYFHVIIRVASQSCGLAFGIIAFENMAIFIAYLILGAEGYFTLVLCTYRFLISWHQHNLPSRESWIEPKKAEDENTWRARVKRYLIILSLGPSASFIYWRSPMILAHIWLIFANAAIVVGGSVMAGVDLVNVDEVSQRVHVSTSLRTLGQAIFLVCNLALIGSILATIWGERKRGKKNIHPTLVILGITWIPLMIRGIYGLLQAFVWSLSYYNLSNYRRTGFTSRILAIDYVLGVLTEWLACVLLNMTYFTSKYDPSKQKDDVNLVSLNH